MDLKALQAKLEKEGLVIRYDKKGFPFVSMPVGYIPLKQYDEFQQFCDANYNGNRWLMIWSMFMRFQQFNLEVEVEALRREIHEPAKEEEDEGNPLGLIGE
jgi:hypothetical protein